MANPHRKGDGAHSSHPPVPTSAAPLSNVPAGPPIQPGLGPRAFKTLTRGDLKDISLRFGQILRAARLRRNYSQEDLASRACVHRTHISLTERGRRESRLHTICALAAALGINPGELMPILFPKQSSERKE
jgi:ribosome-binding protein aMBF1 (putative translation factor)